MIWIKIRRDGGRIEYVCEHDVGHGLHVHGCDSCCKRVDFPLRKHKHIYSLLGLLKNGKEQHYCAGCGKLILRKPKNEESNKS